MRIMAIDYGDARIGLAVSDLTGLICAEAWTMQEWNMERASLRISEEAKKRGVERLVLGLPKNMDGSEGPRAEKSRAFKALLETAALAELYSNHPISRSLREAVKTPLDANRVDEVREIAGHGLTARVDERVVAAGNARLMRDMNIDFTPCEKPGTVVYVAVESKFLGAVLISGS